MNVSDLEIGKGVDTITLEVVEVGEVREWTNARGKGTVCTIKTKDDTGDVSVTLWNDDCDKVKAGDKITIENGWVSEFRGDKQLSTGRFGKLAVNQ
ncbi:MAG: DNA-binding protein [Candidatus Diapherotrites archaeon]|nr:DNA-binding protein [Candidatus Diapherotrites archaeon]